MTAPEGVLVRSPVGAQQHTMGRSVLLHLAPGIPAMAVLVAAVPVARALGLPTIAALALSGLLGAVPVQLALLARHRRQRPEERTNLLTARLPARQVSALVLVELALAAAAFALTAPAAAMVRTYAFAWWPAAWVPDAGAYAGSSRHALLATAALVLVGSVVVTPVVEEHYFRGYLLPRMPARLGRSTPLAHAALFAGYHLWTPWLVPTRVLAVLPLTYVARRTGDLRIGLVTHVVLNAVDLAVLARVVLST